jgi:hypothetical protein
MPEFGAFPLLSNMLTTMCTNEPWGSVEVCVSIGSNCDVREKILLAEKEFSQELRTSARALTFVKIRKVMIHTGILILLLLHSGR